MISARVVLALFVGGLVQCTIFSILLGSCRIVLTDGLI